MGSSVLRACSTLSKAKKLDDFIDTGCKVITPDNAQEYLDKLKSLV